MFTSFKHGFFVCLHPKEPKHDDAEDDADEDENCDIDENARCHSIDDVDSIDDIEEHASRHSINDMDVDSLRHAMLLSKHPTIPI